MSKRTGYWFPTEKISDNITMPVDDLNNLFVRRDVHDAKVKKLEAEMGKSIIEQRTIQKERDQARKSVEFWVKQRAKDRAVNEQWVNDHSALLTELFGFEQDGCVEEKLFCVYEHLINSQTRIKELEAENEKLKATITELSADFINETYEEIDAETRVKELEADLDSETKWAKTYCDAFIKVRDAASNYLNRKEEMMTLGGSSSLKYYRDALDNLERILKETDCV